MGACSSKLDESDIERWSSHPNMDEKSAAKSKRGSRQRKANSRSHKSKGKAKSRSRPKAKWASRDERVLVKGDRSGQPGRTRDKAVASRNHPTRTPEDIADLASPKPPVVHRTLSTPRAGDLEGSSLPPSARRDAARAELSGVKLDFSPSRSNNIVNTSTVDQDNQHDNEIPDSSTHDELESMCTGIAGGVGAALQPATVEGACEREVAARDDDDVATLMSVARGLEALDMTADTHDHNAQGVYPTPIQPPNSQTHDYAPADDHDRPETTEWFREHESDMHAPVRDLNPIEFGYMGSERDDSSVLPVASGLAEPLNERRSSSRPAPEIETRIRSYQSDVDRINLAAPMTTSSHFPHRQTGIGQSPFRKRVDLFEMWNNAQSRSLTRGGAETTVPLKRHDSDELDKISRFTYKQRYEHALSGSQLSNLSTDTIRQLENQVNKENDASKLNTSSNANPESPLRQKVFAIEKFESSPLHEDCIPPSRPDNPHSDHLEKARDETHHVYGSMDDDTYSWMSKLQDHHSLSS